jgi:hypothetical protein
MTLSKIHIYEKMMEKKPCHTLGKLYAFIITSCKKNNYKFIHMETKKTGKQNTVLF